MVNYKICIIIGLILLTLGCIGEDYGEINAQDITVTIPAQNTYYPIPDGNAGLLYEITYTDTNLTIANDGVYKITSQWSFSGTANNEYHLALFNGANKMEHCHSERKLGGGDVGSASYTCIERLTAGDILTPKIENITGAGNATLHDFQLSVHKIAN